MKIKTQIELSEQEKKEILTDAIEMGSIDYWISALDNIRRDSDLWIESCSVWEEGSQKQYNINLDTIQKGINVIFSDGFDISDRIKQMILEDNNDVESCDCIIQAALFGELIYG
jgi:hypothetical protein